MSSPIELLVTLDENYLPHLRVMLGSLLRNSPGEYRVHLIHRSMPEEALEGLARWLAERGCALVPHQVPHSLFAEAPVTKRYPQEMYYRLLAGEILPPEESNDFCHRMVLHGRAVCVARRPDCAGCTLRDLCDYGKTVREP